MTEQNTITRHDRLDNRAQRTMKKRAKHLRKAREKETLARAYTEMAAALRNGQ